MLADVYEYWLLKRRRHGRPLVRSLQIPTSLDNQDPLLTFRWGYGEVFGSSWVVRPLVLSLRSYTGLQSVVGGTEWVGTSLTFLWHLPQFRVTDAYTRPPYPSLQGA